MPKEIKAQRQSNIELLRILTMLGVIILHYNNPSIGGGIRYASGLNLQILYFLESVFICAVNLFVLITGYFMIKTNKRNLMKPLELIIQVIVFNWGFYFLRIVLAKEVFSFHQLIEKTIPVNWFVILYVAVYFISPFINLLMEKLNENQMLDKFVLIIFLLFSVYPTLVDLFQEIKGYEYNGLSSIGAYGSQYGYSIVNFVLMYIIGAWIRIKEKTNKKHDLLYLLITVLLIMGWANINDIIGYGLERSAWEYCNPLVILAAVQLFMIFKSMDLGSNRLINEMSKATFTVFLLHNLFLQYINVKNFVEGNTLVMIMHVIFSALGIYIVCWLVYEIYEHCVRWIYVFLSNKITVLQKNII